MKLVIEGGGVRTAFATGVCDAFAEQGLRFDAVIGSSSGVLAASFFVAGQTHVGCRILEEYIPGNRLISYRRQFTPWGRPGLDVDWLVDDVIAPRLALDFLAQTNTALFFTVTELNAARAHVVRPSRQNFFAWLRAALALPVGYNRVVEVEGKRCIDGGVAAPVPFDVAELAPFAGPLVVLLTRPLQKIKPPPVLWERVAIRLIVPKEARAMCSTQHELHNATMKRLGEAVARGEIVLIEPPGDLPLSRLSRDRRSIVRGIEEGRRVGRHVARSLRA